MKYNIAFYEVMVPCTRRVCMRHQHKPYFVKRWRKK